MTRRLTGHSAIDPGAEERRSGVAPNGKPYESVWDFPRPPALERVDWRIRVIHAATTIVDAPWALRILETSQPPAYYVDPKFVDRSRLVPAERGTLCEWKGQASYAGVVIEGTTIPNAAWSYRSPSEAFRPIDGFWAFYAQSLDVCMVDNEVVVPNPGSFYGGWMTEQVTGPIKGSPGTLHW